MTVHLTLDEADARDLRIHYSIDQAFHTLGALHNVSRKELRERFSAFIEADEEEEREADAARRAIIQVCNREVDA